MVADPLNKIISRDGFAEVISLQHITALLTQDLDLFLGFNPFGNDRQAKAVSKADHGIRNRRIVMVFGNIPDEGLINF